MGVCVGRKEVYACQTLVKAGASGRFDVLLCFVCAHTHTHTHTCMHTHTYTCLFVCLCVFMFVCLCLCFYVFLCFVRPS